MAEYITLLGAEQVQSAASSMRGAAEEMRHAASSIDHSLFSHQRFLDDWLNRLETILEGVQHGTGRRTSSEAYSAVPDATGQDQGIGR